eukprot:TRINITY_DN67037_c0_g1_i1.p2 TRINITY_DN67037_c0_g1~~TRINITY_DN67037_c0_g1_i1.p2  ORF type:complete len:107 (+),score=11.30 TRINITY_DN67037_c0_g1_i1:441-761(+)
MANEHQVMVVSVVQVEALLRCFREPPRKHSSCTGNTGFAVAVRLVRLSPALNDCSCIAWESFDEIHCRVRSICWAQIKFEANTLQHFGSVQAYRNVIDKIGVIQND